VPAHGGRALGVGQSQGAWGGWVVQRVTSKCSQQETALQIYNMASPPHVRKAHLHLFATMHLCLPVQPTNAQPLRGHYYHMGACQSYNQKVGVFVCV